MSRAVLSDHVLFRECIFYLREDLYLQTQRGSTSKDKKTFSCICTTFFITKEWDLGSFSINPSNKVNLAFRRASLISVINNPSWITEGFEHPLLFGEILSCLVSFISLLAVKSPRDVELDSSDPIQESFSEIALTLPFVSAGTGAHQTKLTIEQEDKLIEELKELVSTLNNIEKKDYLFSIQVIRLIHLSILVKRDDFGLAYSLLVFAIEAVAQEAISRKVFREQHPKEKEWGEKAKNDDDFKELLRVYKDSRGKDKYLSKRFTRFIIKFCPPDTWEEIVDSKDHFSDGEWNNHMKGTEHPSKMKTEEIEDILNKVYDYRSRFVHSGTQPPHQFPESSFNKFFETTQIFDGDLHATQINPTYELMLAIAKHSIINWLRTKVKK
ncbi:hypothetical protein [Psychrobacter sp. TWP2-1-2]|uniref:hypothetical protein n=1 Tax=Psychrobacter sp. TWP2-1-2 TaxID=2804623 RepID=UPI003CEDE091